MIFTVNVVDWQQSVLDKSNPVSNQVWKHTTDMLEIMRLNHVTGTFFIHHKVATKYPVLLHKIEAAGHEVGCYIDTPYDHQTFAEQAKRSVSTLQEISGNNITGMRSHGLSLRDPVFENYCYVLRKLGIKYDSSLAISHSIENHLQANPSLGAFKAYDIDEYATSTLVPNRLSPSKINHFGSHLFRVLPYEFTYQLARRLDKDSAVFQLPVYELGYGDLPTIKADHHLGIWQRKDFLGRKSIPLKLTKLFRDYPFRSFRQQYYVNS